MTGAPYYRTIPDPSLNGRWLVVHAIPGTGGAVGVDADCATHDAAVRECAWLEAERAEAVWPGWQIANRFSPRAAR